MKKHSRRNNNGNKGFTIIGEVATNEMAEKLIETLSYNTGHMINHRDILRSNLIDNNMYTDEQKKEMFKTLNELDKYSRCLGEAKQVKIVIGSAFGDEGKGLMTDYFCSRFSINEDVLNVRFNGGSQAGHTVVTPDGTRHVFHHFGSGSFNKNTATYLSEKFIVNPMIFNKEYDELASKGINTKVYIHKDCIITYPSDMLVNQFVEEHRDNNRHGSCGLGIYETIMRNKSFFNMTIGDLKDNIDKVSEILKETVDKYVPKRLEELGVEITQDEWDLIKNTNVINNYMYDLMFMLEHIEIVDDNIINKYTNIVFEGAQGLLLDCANKEYYPHLTPSSTGLENVINILNRFSNCNIEVCYVTRSYSTRHGAGLFKTECDNTEINKEGLKDITNHTNPYQGKFRYGYFDMDTITGAIKEDLKFLNREADIKVAVTHLNLTDGGLAVKGKKIAITELFDRLGIETGYASYSETREQIREYNHGIVIGVDTTFHLSRVAFAELPDGKIVITVDDAREHRVWLRQDFNIDDDTFEKLVRGYIKADRVVFYKGSQFKPVDNDERILAIAQELGSLTDGKNIFDGVKVGNIGEEWKTLNTIRICE